jgi:hypothetical protein
MTALLPTFSHRVGETNYRRGPNRLRSLFAVPKRKAGLARPGSRYLCHTRPGNPILSRGECDATPANASGIFFAFKPRLNLQTVNGLQRARQPQRGRGEITAALCVSVWRAMREDARAVEELLDNEIENDRTRQGGHAGDGDFR